MIDCMRLRATPAIVEVTKRQEVRSGFGFVSQLRWRFCYISLHTSLQNQFQVMGENDLVDAVSQERVFENFCFLYSLQRGVCVLCSRIPQHVPARVRWNTNNAVIGEIRVAFWERQARSCYFARPPPLSASLNFDPFHLPRCVVLFCCASLCRKRNACYFLLYPRFGVKSP